MWPASYAGSTGSSTPSLDRSEGSTVDMSSIPPTPFELSPCIIGQSYTIPPAEMVLLPARAETPQSGGHSALPDIMNPRTAVGVPIRQVCCIGAGYVGGPTAAMMALYNPNVRVTVVDRDEERIQSWKSKHLPIHEPGLVHVVRVARDGSKVNNGESARAPNLFFSTASAAAIANADMILVSVNTPTKLRGLGAGRATDMTAVEGAVRDIAMHARPGTIVVEKSTVPCKTGQLIKDILEAHRPGTVFPVLSNPEFLAEGTAIRDLMRPDRVIIGCESTIAGHRAAAALVNLYAAWVPRAKIVPINIWSSELCKLAANAMLAQRISSINSISAICEKTGADVSEIAKALGMDARIGPQFLKSGLGFGGSCFRKDIASLTYLAESLNLPEVAAYWQQVLTMNNFQRDRFARLVISTLNNSLRGKKVTILGYAFKKNTGDARESPALDVIRLLLDEGPKSISIFDPLCSATDIKRELRVLSSDEDLIAPNGPVEIISDPYQACVDSNAVLVLTDWDMFKNGKLSSFTPTKSPDAQRSPTYATPESIMSPAISPVHVEKINPLSTVDAMPDCSSASYLPSELSNALLPEPVCPAACPECKETHVTGTSSAKDTTTALDWQRISRSVREPRWVFDGRGILDVRAMITMGFRLETLGRASMF